jgi:hypothetical protein
MIFLSILLWNYKKVIQHQKHLLIKQTTSFKLGSFTRTYESINYWQATYSFDYTNKDTKEDFGRDFERH